MPTDSQRQFVVASRGGETRIRNIVIIVAAAVLIALGLLSMVAVNQGNFAKDQAETAVAEANARGTAQVLTEEQRPIAVSRQLAGQAGNTLANQPDLALLLSIESHRTADTVENRDVLLSSILHKPHFSKVFDFGSAPLSVSLSPDAKVLAVRLADSSGELWSMDSRKRTAVVQAGIGPVKRLSFDDSSHVMGSGMVFKAGLVFVESHIAAVRQRIFDLPLETQHV